MIPRLNCSVWSWSYHFLGSFSSCRCLNKLCLDMSRHQGSCCFWYINVLKIDVVHNITQTFEISPTVQLAASKCWTQAEKPSKVVMSLDDINRSAARSICRCVLVLFERVVFRCHVTFLDVWKNKREGLRWALNSQEYSPLLFLFFKDQCYCCLRHGLSPGGFVPKKWPLWVTCEKPRWKKIQKKWSGSQQGIPVET